MPLVRTIAAVHRGPRLFAWRVAAEGLPRGGRAIVIVHGAGEHSQRYLPAAKRLAREGWEVVGFDLRGHGCSDGPPVHVRSFADYTDDLARVACHFQLRPERTGVLAHSLGGLVAITAAQRGAFVPGAMALSAPLLRLAADVPALKLLTGRLVKRAWPTTRFTTSVRPEHLLNDGPSREARLADPLISRTLTAGWFFSVMGASRRIWRAGSVPPTLLMQGTADRVVDPAAAVEWAAERGPSCTLQTMPGAAHELLHEPDGCQLAVEAGRWMAEQMPASVPLRRAA